MRKVTLLAVMAAMAVCVPQAATPDANIPQAAKRKAPQFFVLGTQHGISHSV